MESAAPSRERKPWLTPAFCAALPLMQVLGGGSEGFAVLQREGLSEGRFLTLWTSSLVHTGWSHMLWNLLGALVLFGLLEREGRRLLVWVWFLGAPVGAVVSLVGMPMIQTYAGLSCVLHAALGALVWCWWRQGARAFALALLTLDLAKLGLELYGQGPSSLQDGVLVTTPGHVAGLLCGLAIGLAMTKLSVAPSSCHAGSHP